MLVRQLVDYLTANMNTLKTNGPLETFLKDNKEDGILSFTDFQTLCLDVLPKEEISTSKLDFHLTALIVLGSSGLLDEKIYSTLAPPDGAQHFLSREENLRLALGFLTSDEFKKAPSAILQNLSPKVFVEHLSASKQGVESKEKSMPKRQTIDGYLDHFCDYFIAQQILAKNQKYAALLQKILALPLVSMKGRYLEAVNVCLELQKNRLYEENETAFLQELAKNGDLQTFKGRLLFNKKVIEQKLNYQTGVPALTQAMVEVYNHSAYPGHVYAPPPTINRKNFGAFAACSAMSVIWLVNDLYEEHLPSLMPKDLFDETIIKLITLAIGYIYSANTSDTYDGIDEKKAAENFICDMGLLGFKMSQVNLIADAIYKIKRPGDATTIYDYLIHDVYYFDTLRLPNSPFKKQNLHFYRLQQDKEETGPGLLALDSTITGLNEHYQFLFGTDPTAVTQVHSSTEFAENCYDAIPLAIINNIKNYIILAAFRQNKKVGHRALDEQLKKLKNADCFNYKNSLAIKKIIAELPDDALELKTPTVPEELKGPHLMRVLLHPENELAQLSVNEMSLRHHSLQETEALRQKYVEGATSPALPKFKWRPSTLMVPAVPIKPFDADGMAVLISTDSKRGTHIPFLYKKNATSNLINSRLITSNPQINTLLAKLGITSLFLYENNNGPLKNRKTVQALTQKITEQDRRRQGIEEDIGLHYFGYPGLLHNEVLTSYKPEGVLGIVIGKTKASAIQAIEFCYRLPEPRPGFYRYEQTTGTLTAMSRAEIIEIIDADETQALTKEKAPAPLDIRSLGPITCPTRIPSNREISPKNPLKFQFLHPEYKTLCTAYVKNRIPVLEYSDGKETVTQPTQQLHAIAMAFYQQKLADLNRFLQENSKVKEMLQKKLGAKNLTFSLIPEKGARNQIAITFTLEKQKHRGTAYTQLLCDILQLDVAKYKHTSTAGTYCIAHFDFHNIDSYQSLFEQGQQQLIDAADFNSIMCQYRSTSRLARYTRFFSPYRNGVIERLLTLAQFRVACIDIQDGSELTIEALRAKTAEVFDHVPILVRHQGKLHLFCKKSPQMPESKDSLIELDVRPKLHTTLQFQPSDVVHHESNTLHPEILSQINLYAEGRQFGAKKFISVSQITEAIGGNTREMTAFLSMSAPRLTQQSSGTVKVMASLRNYFVECRPGETWGALRT